MNKKINLSTGKITQLDIEDTIIPSTFIEDGRNAKTYPYFNSKNRRKNTFI